MCLGPYTFKVAARRCRQLCVNDLNDPEPILRDTEYASVIENG
ncbi:MAG: sensory rhodopsin transducer [Pirellulaceae bacterium]